ncbi:MAG TPA: molybdopterin cofactor-binding domain-containing protein [Steroidobacteraceae bacterium]|nr:molybdopterin cofactor-binding domain-containing protein [Steroidobacteraceae bacterium]
MKITRRKAIVGTFLAGGAVVFGYALWPYPQRERERALLGHGKDAVVLNTWIKIARDNSVTIVVPHQDMGQGAVTGLAQMATDELDADWNLVSVIEAPAHKAFVNPALMKSWVNQAGLPESIAAALGVVAPQLSRAVGFIITGGSSSISGTGQHAMRPAGAAVRGMLIAAAAQTWSVPQRELTAANSQVTHVPSGRKATYGELIDIAATLEPPSAPQLKTPDQFTLIGKPLPRLDIPAKVTGSAPYAIDTRLQGMKFAAIRHSPVVGGTIESVDESALIKRRGVERVVQLPATRGGLFHLGASDAAVAVVADNTWRAESAARALAVKFAAGDNGGISTSSMFAAFEKAVAGAPEKDIRKEGDVESALRTSAKVIEASYRAPFLEHAAMEPHSATALVRSNGTAEIWAGSQAPLLARSLVASELDIDEAGVVFHSLPMGGGFGRRTFADCAVQAARIAAAMPDTPIKLTWSREETLQHGKYRPPGVSRFKAGLDKEGNPIAWLNVYNWHDDSAALIPYGVPNQHIGHVDAKAPIPTGPWRSVGHSRHAFFTESFVDELAHAAGVDPYRYRRKLLAASPRHLAVLDLAAEKGNWDSEMPKGSGRGIAFQECFGSVTAQVAEVSPDADGILKVDRIVCVIDCGIAVNPGQVEAQIQGGVLFGLSAALYGEITFREGRVEQSNFHDYPLLRLADAPRVEVHILRSDARPGGVGEPGTPGAAPAVANAVFAATGQRLRAMPFKLHELNVVAGKTSA